MSTNLIQSYNNTIPKFNLTRRRRWLRGNAVSQNTKDSNAAVEDLWTKDPGTIYNLVNKSVKSKITKGQAV